MSLSLPCPECKRVLKLPPSAAGQSVRCPMCATVFTAADDLDAANAAAPVPPVRNRPVEQPVRRPSVVVNAPVDAPVPPRGPVSKPWAGRVGAGVVIAIVLFVLRIGCYSTRHTGNPPANEFVLPTLNRSLTFPLPLKDTAKASHWHAPRGDPKSFVTTKNNLPRRRLVLDFGDTAVTGMALSPDEHTLAVACETGAIYRFDPMTGVLAAVFDGDGAGPVAVAYSRDGNYLASTMPGEKAVRLHLTTIDFVLSHVLGGKGDLGAGCGLAFAPTNNSLAFLRDRRLELLRVPSWEEEETPSFPGPVASFAFTPDGKAVAVALDGGTISVGNLGERQPRRTLAAGAPLRSPPYFSPDGTLLAACVGVADLKVWNVKTGEEIKTLRDAVKPQGFRSGAFAPDGNTFATWQDDGVIRLWDVKAGTVVADLAGGRCDSDVAPVLVFTKDGTTLIVGGGTSVTFWDVGRGK